MSRTVRRLHEIALLFLISTTLMCRALQAPVQMTALEDHQRVLGSVRNPQLPGCSRRSFHSAMNSVGFTILSCGNNVSIATLCWFKSLRSWVAK